MLLNQDVLEQGVFKLDSQVTLSLVQRLLCWVSLNPLNGYKVADALTFLFQLDKRELECFQKERLFVLDLQFLPFEAQVFYSNRYERDYFLNFYECLMDKISYLLENFGDQEKKVFLNLPFYVAGAVHPEVHAQTSVAPVMFALGTIATPSPSNQLRKGRTRLEPTRWSPTM